MEKLGVVIVAGGKGTRMKSSDSKQYLLLGEHPILVHTIKLFQGIEEIDEIVLVVGEQDIQRNEEYAEKYGFSKITKILPGGLQRQDSSYIGIKALSPSVEWVMVHDAVRPFTTAEQVRQCWQYAIKYEAAVLAVPVKETIKIVNKQGFIVTTPDRSSLWTIQTPQAFRVNLLLDAHAQAKREHFLGTDDSMLVERIGKQVSIVQGDYYNIKITTPEDLVEAEYILKHVRRGELR